MRCYAMRRVCANICEYETATHDATLSFDSCRTQCNSIVNCAVVRTAMRCAIVRSVWLLTCGGVRVSHTCGFQLLSPSLFNSTHPTHTSRPLRRRTTTTTTFEDFKYPINWSCGHVWKCRRRHQLDNACPYMLPSIISLSIARFADHLGFRHAPTDNHKTNLQRAAHTHTPLRHTNRHCRLL